MGSQGRAKKLVAPPEKVEAKLEKHTKHDLIEIVHRARCMKLQGIDTDTLTKEELIAHLVKSECPEIAKLLKLSPKTS